MHNSTEISILLFPLPYQVELLCYYVLCIIALLCIITLRLAKQHKDCYNATIKIAGLETVIFFIIGPMEIAEKAKQLLFCYYAISLYYDHLCHVSISMKDERMSLLSQYCAYHLIKCQRKMTQFSFHYARLQEKVIMARGYSGVTS